MKRLLFSAIVCICCQLLTAEDGSRLWLRSEFIGKADVTVSHHSPTIALASQELQNHWKGKSVKLERSNHRDLRELTPEGYSIRTEGNRLVISSSGDKGLLYGAFHLLRLQETGSDLSALNIREKPSYQYRILNHWDNLDRTIERGYAGRSLWLWDELPGTLSPRYEMYARANASLGINGTVLNNVNASPLILSAEYLEKVKALAGIFRPYGIKVYLSINFSSPAELGGLPTSDPLDPAVRKWWKDKAKEIYNLIPDFGGFLVKANSEGLPGPHDFGRTHVDGANMIADALKPYKGIVMWRAFVYEPEDGDRAKQAYQEFVPLDGQFRDNVIIQIKNGPVDFQPREPFSPLIGALKKTPAMVEFQITQEYTGFSNHLNYLAPIWKECLDSDTWQQGEGSTVARVTDGSIYPQKLTAIAGVTNIGDDINWCGHHFAQSNWYAFGRLAWNHELTSEEIADEWLKQTFSLTGTEKRGDVNVYNEIKEMMLTTNETIVDYMMPLGLHHLFAFGHHYGPEPWCAIPGARTDWMPSYYHKADKSGIGFDRSTGGSNAVSQYESPLKEIFNDPARCPDELLLWFHHVPWNHTMQSGRTLWDEMCYRYARGAATVKEYQKVWENAVGFIDAQRFEEVRHRLKIQTRDAEWWRDGCLLYFQEFSDMEFPRGMDAPVHELKNMKEYKLRITNYENPTYEMLFKK